MSLRKTARLGNPGESGRTGGYWKCKLNTNSQQYTPYFIAGSSRSPKVFENTSQETFINFVVKSYFYKRDSRDWTSPGSNPRIKFTVKHKYGNTIYEDTQPLIELNDCQESPLNVIQGGGIAGTNFRLWGDNQSLDFKFTALDRPTVDFACSYKIRLMIFFKVISGSVELQSNRPSGWNINFIE